MVADNVEAVALAKLVEMAGREDGDTRLLVAANLRVFTRNIIELIRLQILKGYENQRRESNGKERT